MDNDKTLIDENDEIVTLTYEDGSQEDFYTMAELDYNGKWYAYLVPVDPAGDFADDEVLVYEIAAGEEGEEVFLPVEDEELLNDLVNMLNAEINETDGESGE